MKIIKDNIVFITFVLVIVIMITNVVDVKRQNKRETEIELRLEEGELEAKELKGLIQNMLNTIEKQNISIEKQNESLETQNNNVNELLEMKETWDKLKFDKFTSTAYAPYDNVSGMCNDGNPNKTSTGSKPSRGTFAVNPKTIPYGSEMLVIGDGWFEHGKALDTGGAMRRNPKLIDIYKDTYKETVKFGRQNVTVVYKEKE